MWRLDKTRPARLPQLFVLICLAGSAPGCAPSAFDGLTGGTTREPATCASSKCLDGSSLELEAAQTYPDAHVEPLESAADDVPVESASDAAASDDSSAAADALTQTEEPDALVQPPACDGNGPVCRAGEVMLRTLPCQTCGTKTQSQSCSVDTCAWEPWIDTSACTWCDACSEVVYCDTPSNIADRGTWCRQKSCSREQALANCLEDAQSVCGGAKEPFFMEYL
jgi:hypothetical protein